MENRNRNRNRNNRFEESGNDYSQNEFRSRENYGRGTGNYNQDYNDVNRNYDDFRSGDSFGNERNWRHESAQQWNEDSDRNWRDNDRSYGSSHGNYGYEDRNWRSDTDRNWRDEMMRNRSNANRGYGSGNYSSGNYGNDYGHRSNDWRRNDSYGSDFERGYERSFNNRNDDYQNRNNDRTWWDRTTDEVSSWFGDDDAERRRRMDKMNTESHKGRGPKGYKRSDDRIREDVNDRLSDDHYLDASEIEVNVKEGEVTLTGSIESKAAKRRAEDIAESISGVTNVQNNLRVAQQKGNDNLGKASSRSEASSTVGQTGSTINTSGGALATSHQNGHKSKATH